MTSILFMILLALGVFALIYLVSNDHQEHGMRPMSVIRATIIVVVLSLVIFLFTQGGQ